MMYNREVVNRLIAFIANEDGITDKSHLSSAVQQAFGLVKERSVFYCEWFSIRFCTAASRNFSNTVLALSALHKYDNTPFIVCLVTPTRNYLMLANTTFLKKISHSSQELRQDNIKGSFNGSDVMRAFEGVDNIPENFEFLFSSHENYTFEENLGRLVEATNNIAPTGKRFIPSESQITCIRESVNRAISFLCSDAYNILNNDLNNRVQSVESEIAIAAFIDNVNLRGRIIEYLITAEDDLKTILIGACAPDSRSQKYLLLMSWEIMSENLIAILQKQISKLRSFFYQVTLKVTTLINFFHSFLKKEACIWFTL